MAWEMVSGLKALTNGLTEGLEPQMKLQEYNYHVFNNGLKSKYLQERSALIPRYQC